MTKAKPFKKVLGSLQDLLIKKAEKDGRDSSSLRDFDVMAELDFSPQSWPRWRPQLAEASKYEEIIEYETFRGDRVSLTYEKKRGHIEFIKKLKVWKYEMLPLRKKLPNSDDWIELTEDEKQNFQCEQ